MNYSVRTIVILAVAAVGLAGARPLPAQTPTELARWEARARNVEILRDRWGIAHVYGATDADAVFGMVYAQAEDDFPRVEHNYARALGRRAEVEGEDLIWWDLRARLWADPDSLQAQYAASPDWLKALMDAFADGLNYYLYTHPDVRPAGIDRFEPWMALSFTEGSIGGDIERVSLRDLEAFYGAEGGAGGLGSGGASGAGAGTPADAGARVAPTLSLDPHRSLAAQTSPETNAVESPSTDSWAFLPAPEPRGSNGFAIAPENTLNGNALLFINTHTSFYFRSELQMVSEEGLNAYGAVTWGQFFIYQGFNERAGWMHTSSGVDNIDWFLESTERRGDGWIYRYGGEERPVAERTITIPYRTDAGDMAERTFTAYFTHRGPVVGREGNRWLSVALMWQPVEALTQSYVRTKADDLDDYLEVMRLHTNSSNNTVYADASGNIAYLHSNYIPRRDPGFDWTRPVDGSDLRTAYDGVLSIEETPNAINPSVGWAFNTNNFPWSAAGPDSPDSTDYPAYVDTYRWENARGQHALKLLPGRDDWTMASLTEAAYDSWLPSFELMVPALIGAFDALPAGDARRAELSGPVEVLRGWDHRWGVSSVATSLAVFWGEDVLRRVRGEADAAGHEGPGEDFVADGASAGVLLESLGAAARRLEADFGTWQTPWGHINRFQRISPEIGPVFDDDRHSIPVPFTSARWGSLASFGARPYPNTKRWYGTSGNSFVAVVEFGDSVRARALSAGGESGDPASPHFDDQAAIYAMGALRDVYFYRPDVEAQLERRYRPGGAAR
ncbi:MAG TPA: penicillin acylase family protein [Longimicrobiales bacterium]|nr:penicillin acylase family protein [Longimicrobiales bacterium]